MWLGTSQVGFTPGAIWNVLQERNLKKKDEGALFDLDVRGALRPVTETPTLSSGRAKTPGSPGFEVERTAPRSR